MENLLNELAAFLFPSFVVACFAAAGFNKPTWIRSYATAVSYRCAMTLYILAHLLIFSAMWGALVWLGEQLEGMEFAKEWLGTGGAALLALCAWLIVRLLPLSSKMKFMIHGAVGIPARTHRFAATLATLKLEPVGEIAREARSLLASLGVNSELESLPRITDSVHELLFNATCAFIQLRRWSDEPRFSRFMGEATNEFNVLRRRFDGMTLRVSRELKSIERMGELRRLYSIQGGIIDSPDFDAVLKRVVGDAVADCCEDIGVFYDDACLLIARGAMFTQSTRSGRDRLVSHLGFEVSVRPPRVPYGTFAIALLAICAGVALSLNLLPPITPPSLKVGQKIVVITIIMVTSFATAVVPKMRWGFANAGLHEKSPIGFVIGAGLLAVVLAAGINLLAGAILLREQGAIAGAIARFKEGMMYLHFVFLTASTLAWLVQNHRWRRIAASSMRRLLDGLVLAAGWVAGTLVLYVIVQANDDSLATRIIVALIIGGLVGSLVPESVRFDYMRDINAREDATGFAAATRSTRTVPA